MKVAFGALALTACATIHTVESTTDLPAEPLISHEVEKQSLEFVGTAVLRGYELHVSVEQSEQCATVRTPRVHRRRYVRREVDATASRLTWGLAIAGLGGGVYGYIDADSVAARSMDGTSPEQVRQYSAGLVTVGAVAALVGLVDAVRAEDSRFDDGLISSAPTRERFVCRQQRTKNTDVALVLANGAVVRGKTDDDGGAVLSFLDVPEDGLPVFTATLEFFVDGTSTSLGGLGYRDRLQLRESLLAEPRSRLAIDELEKRRQACDRAVNWARSGTPVEPGDVPQSARASWSTARAACDDLWTPQMEAELLAVEERIQHTDCRVRLGRAELAFVDGAGTTVGEMSEELAALRDICTRPETVAELRKLSAKLAGVVARLEREAAAEARRAERERARAAAAYRAQIERARTQRSVAEPEPSWPSSPTRSCCKVCSKGKACGNSCIAAWKTCHKGVGCACDG